jgi:DNA-binding transcriptional MerR regulator
MAKMSILEGLLNAGNWPTSASDHDGAILLISKVAEKVDMEPKTIRFYEKAGLLKPRRLGQLRIFSQDDVEVLLLIKQLRQYGMPIARVREAIHLHQQKCEEGNSKLESILKLQLKTLSDKHLELAEQIAVLKSTLTFAQQKCAA